MDTTGYELSDLEDIKFFWENPQVELDAVFRPGKKLPFHQQAATTWRWEKEDLPKNHCVG